MIHFICLGLPVSFIINYLRSYLTGRTLYPATFQWHFILYTYPYKLCSYLDSYQTNLSSIFLKISLSMKFTSDNYESIINNQDFIQVSKLILITLLSLSWSAQPIVSFVRQNWPPCRSPWGTTATRESQSTHHILKPHILLGNASASRW
jgi:hypothetical protein